MPKSPSPCSLLCAVAGLAVSLAMIVAMAACGGSSSSTSSSGGGNPPPSGDCTQPAPVTAASTGKAPVNPGVVTFTDLHMGSSNLPWPAGPNGQPVPFGGLRLWDTGTGWAQINTAEKVFDFSSIDAFAMVAQTNNVDLLYNLARTPTWASSNPTDSTCSYDTSTQGGPGQCDPPVDLNSDGSGTDADWIAWITALAQHNATSPYAHIKYYEIWNEWNIQLFWNPSTGTIPELVRMEQDARCVVEGPPPGKQCNPNSTFPSGTGLDPEAQIVSPSPVGAGSSSTTLNAVASNLTNYYNATVNGYPGGSFADNVGFHGYVGTPSTTTPIYCPIPENVTIVLGNLYNAVNGTSLSGKPWFDTESGWSKAESEEFIDPDRQDAFLPRYMLLQWSMGVDRMYWYRWDETQEYGGALWNATTGPIEAVTAWQEVSKWMVGASMNSCAPLVTSSTQDVWACSITRPSGYQALAVWDAAQDCLNGSCTTSTFNIPNNVTYTEYRDIAGNESSVTGSTIAVGAKPILLETGPLP